MTIAITSRANIEGTVSASRAGGTDNFTVNVAKVNDIANGTGAGQANAVYELPFSIAASGSLNIDLSGTLADPNGNTVIFTGVKEILIVADATNVNDVIVGNGTYPFVGPFGAAAHTMAVRPGAKLNVSDGYTAAGWPVVAATGDILKLANSAAGTAVTGTIVIVGNQ